MSTKTRTWCETDFVPIKFLGFRVANKKHEFKKRQRCPKCNRMLTVVIRDCHDVGCKHLYIPPHKGKYK